MKHLLAEFESLKQQFFKKPVFLFLDYDGTLAPIVSGPELAVLKPQNREILQALAHESEIQLAVISGRMLGDIKEKIGIPGIIYGGNHGLELEGPGLRHLHPAASEFQHFSRKLTASLRKSCRTIPEILVEGKNFTLSVHYRNVPEHQASLAKMILLKEIGPYLGRGQVCLTEGKKVWEVRPPTEWNKGRTVLWLLARMSAHTGCQYLPVYAGDDVTDEDAFKALKGRGVTVKVADDAQPRTEAEYYVWKPEDVFKFLKQILILKKNKREQTYDR